MGSRRRRASAREREREWAVVASTLVACLQSVYLGRTGRRKTTSQMMAAALAPWPTASAAPAPQRPFCGARR